MGLFGLFKKKDVKQSEAVENAVAQESKIKETETADTQSKENETVVIDNKETVPVTPGYEYKTHMISGEQLKKTLDSVKGFEKRDCYNALKEFLFSNTTDRVCLIYGLRRTGKTIMMRQAMLEMSDEDLEKCAYIKITVNDTMKDLNDDFKHLRESGYKYVFIDEITQIADFVNNAAILSDIYAAEGMKIVLSGTDSLAFWYTVKGELYDRAVSVHTTHIPYSEYKKVTGKDDFDTYIKTGGILSPSPLFADTEATENYVNTSIINNIVRSINGYDVMRDEIAQVMDAIAYNYIIEALIDDTSSYEMKLSARYLKNQKDSRFDLDSSRVKKFRDYLKAIDAISYVNDGSRIVFTQPGLMYSKIDTFLEELMSDRHYSSMTDVEKNVFLGNIHGKVMMLLRQDYGSLEPKIARDVLDDSNGAMDTEDYSVFESDEIEARIEEVLKEIKSATDGNSVTEDEEVSNGKIRESETETTVSAEDTDAGDGSESQADNASADKEA